MHRVEILRKKRFGQEYSADEIETVVRAAVDGSWPDYQLSAWLMAVCIQGLNDEETSSLTRAMTNSGVRLDLSEFGPARVDKHSTGGVGDKTSLIIAPLVAACGAFVPMMSGRGLGHTGGTLDKLEAIPGFRVGLSISEFKQALKQVGAAMISQTSEVAPADKKLYALRDVTGTVESIPLITASILCKKLAEGINGLVLDVKFGHGAFMKTLPDAKQLAESLVRVGTASGLQIRALLTAMNNPLGLMIGNALEVRECVQVLKGSGPPDLVELSIVLATRMLQLSGLFPEESSARKQIEQALHSGRGLDKFRQMVKQQGGNTKFLDDDSALSVGPHQELVKAEQSGYLQGLHAEQLGLAAVCLGAGRRRAEDAVDHAVGIQLHMKPGEQVRAGDSLLTVYYREPKHLPEVFKKIRSAITIGDVPPTPETLIAEEL
jgi:pyrimidine-nucleoside phosphorylase